MPQSPTSKSGEGASGLVTWRPLAEQADPLSALEEGTASSSPHTACPVLREQLGQFLPLLPDCEGIGCHHFITGKGVC